MPETTIDIKSFENLKALAGSDFIGELIDTFLADGPNMIQQLRDALAKHDVDTFRRAAHSLKSNAASFGASTLTAHSRELEELARENKLSEIGSRLKVLEDAYRDAARELKGMRS